MFKGTHIHEQPTPGKNSYLILKFNFSQVNPDSRKVEESFGEHTETCFFFFGERYRDYSEDRFFQMMEKKTSARGKLEVSGPIRRNQWAQALCLDRRVRQLQVFRKGRARAFQYGHGALFHDPLSAFPMASRQYGRFERENRLREAQAPHSLGQAFERQLEQPGTDRTDKAGPSWGDENSTF